MPKKSPRKPSRPEQRKRSVGRKPRVSATKSERISDFSFPVVGVGASAGGVEAFAKLLEKLPENSGMAFVLVPHLAPDHKSELALVLSRKTALPVAEARNHERLEPNRVYVIPPNKQMVLNGGTLRISPREVRSGTPRSIDIFLESLAHDQGIRAIGIILSGTANDGTLGLEAIKAEGGFTFAQDSSARHDSMPRNAIASGCVDLVLSPEGIARELVRMTQHPHFGGKQLGLVEGESAEIMEHASEKTPLPSGGHDRPDIGARAVRKEANEAEVERARDELFKPVIELLRNYTGVDFALYKSNTIQRRISRRMVLSKCASLREYATLLKKNPKELDALYSDVLISVTSFFRNPEVFDFLQGKVFPRLFAERREDPVRVWVLGCSTGQEAYSLAMVLDEYFDRQSRKLKYQIFASDLNESLLAKARTGLYSKTVVQDVSPERLRRFFTEEDGGYRICKSLRDSIVFARQNLIHDPPFSRMDMISCRNVLIYLDTRVHRRIVPVFHYSLKPNGFLILGSSESVGPFNELFEPLDRKYKLFIKKPAPTPPLHLGSSLRDWSEKKSRDSKPPLPAVAAHPEMNIQREADRVALNRYVPASVLIDTNLQVLYFRGDTSLYLIPPTGRATFSLLHMSKEGLLPSLRSLLSRAVKQHKPARIDSVEWSDRGKPRRTSVEVVPLTNVKERCYLVFFEEGTRGNRSRFDEEAESYVEPAGRSGTTTGNVRELRAKVAQLERALAEGRDYLQSVQEQYEAVNEELQAANEEATSANEELQSTNEELETSKEELESTNEELNTVNEELASRNSELTLANSDLQNIYANVNMAVILFSRDFSVRRFTKPAEKLFNLVDSDIGRSISTIRSNLELDDLEKLLTEVIDSVSLQEREVRSREGQWYVL